MSMDQSCLLPPNLDIPAVLYHVQRINGIRITRGREGALNVVAMEMQAETQANIYGEMATSCKVT